MTTRIKDLVFLYKASYGYFDIDTSFVKSASNGQTWRFQSSIKSPWKLCPLVNQLLIGPPF